MSEPIRGDITNMLAEWAEGDRQAAERVFPLVYEELRRAADGLFRRESPGHTLQPTAVVHEAYVKLVGSGIGPVRDRTHFYTLAARVMRHLLVDHARARNAEKRGGARATVSLDADTPALVAECDVLALHDALGKLASLSERKARLVELRCFAGLTIEEAGDLLGVSRSTIGEEWRFVRACLARELTGARTP